VPFGWRREGDHLVPVPDQQAAIERMREPQADAEGVRVSHVAVANALKAGDGLAL
jgi:hypothetical protein